MLIRLKSIKQRNLYKKSLFVIPYLFTYLNAIFGFLSILKSLECEYKMAALYIILAAFMDAFDGRLARALGSSSCFGMELDSLCDAISFCLAPTILLYSFFSEHIAFGGTIALVFYLCAGLGRLAKFNTAGQNQPAVFTGLPTTIAAFFIASLVLYNSWISSHSLYWLLSKNVLFPLIAAIALLMISPIQFYSLKRYKIQLPRDYPKLFLLFAIFSWAVIYGYPLIFFALSFYILSCIVIYSVKLLIK